MPAAHSKSPSTFWGVSSSCESIRGKVGAASTSDTCLPKFCMGMVASTCNDLLLASACPPSTAEDMEVDSCDVGRPAEASVATKAGASTPEAAAHPSRGEKQRKIKPSRISKGMLPRSTTRNASMPASDNPAALAVAHACALLSCFRLPQSTTINQGPRLRFVIRCSWSSRTQGCASRQSVTSAKGGLGARLSQRPTCFAFLKLMSDPPYMVTISSISNRCPSFSGLWQRSWHHTSLHEHRNCAPLGT
mmetsp:Transcript_122330/g.351462  ORF Transcript_122330/g.351462 Transcript_122330/m.351462 type:complete len:248 (-) Transcript_122330:84-827(-)